MSARIEPTLLRKLNERRVLELIQQRGPLSRATLTRISGMSAPTVSKAVASLLDAGLLEEIDAPIAAFGRPAKLVRLAAASAQVLGVVIEPGQTWVVASGIDGRIDPARSKAFSTSSDYDTLIDRISAELQHLQEDIAGEIHGVGLTVPGLMHATTAKVLISPNLHLLDDHAPGEDLADRTGLNCVALQESHALCVGEKMFGDARGLNDFAMMDVSTGLGLGVMSGGKLLTGHSGLAGELGHITVAPHGLLCGCGNRGCLETLATDAALARAISSRMGQTMEISDAVQLIRDGAIDARQELDQVAEYLAIACAAVINIFNPTSFFMHGALFAAADHLFELVLERTGSRALKPSLADCRIVQARGSKQQAAIAGILRHLTHSWAPTLS